MTKAETAKIMATLWAAYPGFYSKAGNGDQAAAVELWQKCFEAEPYELVSAAVYALIKVRPNSILRPSGKLRPRSSGLSALTS